MARESKQGGGIDLATIAGAFLAVCGLLGGLVLEGGSLNDILQLTAALIVLGGTVGAVMINTPGSILMGALRRIKSVFFSPHASIDDLLERILYLAAQARRTGLVSLEAELNTIHEPFLRKTLGLAVDGAADARVVRSMMEVEIVQEEQRTEAEAKVFECAGGYSPTIGIIGAVMGLIQVMKHLEDVAEVGHGIAVAFVATVYGVAFANLVFLPIANKIKAHAREDARRHEMMLDGVLAIMEGLNPNLIRAKLEAYTGSSSDQPRTMKQSAEARAA